MIRSIGISLISVASLALMCVSVAQETVSTRPKVRAITAFVRVSDAFEPQISDALNVLKDTKSEFEQRGYEVETVRIVTQPLAELVRGKTDEQAIAYLKRLDDLFW